MPRNSSSANITRFRKLMAAYQAGAAKNLNEDESRLIDCIASSAEAAQAFATIATIKDDVTAKRILTLCVESYTLAETFDERIKHAK